VFERGLGFDGSSIRAFQDIHESDMILMPDPTTAIVDPITRLPTLSVVCDIYDPITHEPYTRDTRYVARKAERYLRASGIADISYWGPEAEFFVFDGIRFDYRTQGSYVEIESDMAAWERWAGATMRAMGLTWAIGPKRNAATSACRRWTRCRTSGARRSCAW